MPTCFIEKGQASVPSVCNYVQSLPLPIITSINLQKTWTDKNDLDMLVKSDQEITEKNKQCIEDDIFTRIISTLTENMDRWSWCSEL